MSWTCLKRYCTFPIHPKKMFEFIQPTQRSRGCLRAIMTTKVMLLMNITFAELRSKLLPSARTPVGAVAPTGVLFLVDALG
jgi:hypothetical protein